jgi:hypothetical protein
MAGKYRGTKGDVKVKIARILVQKRSSYLTTYPLSMSALINLASYDPNVTNGWQEVGLTIQPTTESEGFDKTDITTQQFGKINVRKGDYTRTLTFAPAEQDQLTRELAKGGVDFNDDAVNQERRMFFTNTKDETVWRVAVLDFDDETEKASASIFPYVKRSGDSSDRVWDKDNAQDYTIAYEVFTDPQIVDSNGEEVAVYDIWQY